jgi:outer membrane protein
MKQKLVTLALGCLFAMALQAQEKWDLQKCVDYALANNISVKQSDIQARLQALQLKQANMNLYPTVNGGLNNGFQFGRSIDPTSNSFTTQTLYNAGLGIQANFDVYNWGRKRKTIEALQFDQAAAGLQIDKVKNDIALNVALFYLNTLLAKEGVRLAQLSIKQNTDQLYNTRKRVEAGALPELNAAQIEAQISLDSSSLVDAENSERNALLSLKALMNLDLATNFDIGVPNLSSIPVDKLADLNPEALYALALNTQPQQKINTERLKSAEKNVELARTAVMPSISLSAAVNSNFIGNAFPQPVGSPITVQTPKIGTVAVGGINYDVLSVQNFTTYAKFEKPGVFEQLDQNFRQSISMNISVPIFNAQQGKIGIERAKLGVLNQQTQAEADNLRLKQDIYTAYNQAVGAFAKVQAATKSLETNERAYNYATKRFELGLMNTMDYILVNNNVNRARIDLARSQFDYVFRMKILEFYKGNGIRL